jgi:microsomal dipeptidase-like Zn-dependent dipeptidase
MRWLLPLLATILLSIPNASQCQPLRGVADLHNHQFANLAFGGLIVSGDAYGPIEEALNPSRDRYNHGEWHTIDFVGSILSARGLQLQVYSNAGYPEFNGWPTFMGFNHQKVYQDWLYRAVQGGLRLMVMLAVDSPTLCRRVRNDSRDCDDEMRTIDLQIDAAYAMQEYIDREAGGRGLGWYRVVTTPTEARRAIRTGKLAVVLGIETAYLFNCNRVRICDWRSELERQLRRGVRHFFPIHQYDNVFGGASYFAPLIQAQTNWLTRRCPEYETGRCNVLGLSETGVELVQAIMRRGALIDVDHMSDQAFADTLDIAEQNIYPVIASHAGFNEINRGSQSHEGQLTDAEFARIRAVGGMIGLITGQADVRQEIITYARPGRHEVAHICGRTTETFAQALYYALDQGGGMPVAVGSDFNGPLGQPGPRFGPFQCFLICTGSVSCNRDATRQKWEEALTYPFLARGAMVELERFRSGQRTFDFNTDGLAHIGMLPDFLADLEVLGIPSEELEPVFRSAERYVELWERAVHASQRLAGPLDAEWVQESWNIASFALEGDRIGVLQNDGVLWVKEGPLDAEWVQESWNIRSFALEGDRIGVLQNDGVLWVKEGPLDAEWVQESWNVRSFALEGDRIGVLNTSGTLFVKEGPLDAPWTEESWNVASFALEGGRIGVLDRPGALFVKEGPLDSLWVAQSSPVQAFALSGARIGALNTSGTLFVKGGE